DFYCCSTDSSTNHYIF
nr:immunoglobulin light chain junction region [Macaca mulatta]MOX43123.1 immunoglobulin light chain junction region [Macaca mulatta]MOX43794.1 immunoglobulin light chain junction region [Macaca mulatta]MOX43811.1 immunoglobulin light chain junction region [Macaca mulatta]MOX45214.1 immunoglobulin light chain junction region [Macaca mulatta]